jgi:alkylation response protein AidB-like acyl-CoA dehydrogenase
LFLNVDLDLTTEQEELFQAAIEFGRSSFGTAAPNGDQDCGFDRSGWDKCREFGLFGMPVPGEYGGLGLGLPAVIAVMEGLGYAVRDQGLLFSINAHLWTNTIPVLTYGTEEQKRKYLPLLASGEWIGANAATEPEAGSDVFAMRTHAARRGDSYILNGTKTFVTNAQVADLFVTYATIDPSLGPMGVTGFLIERNRPGITIGKSLEKMGLRGSPMAEVYFNDCEVPVTQRLGREGRGAGVFECAMEWERGCILATCLGVMRRQLEQAIRHAQSRKQFGKPIGKYQSVANRIVDLRLRLDTCRPLIYRIGRLKDAGKTAQLEAAIAKLYVSECFVKSCLDVIQIFGGYGYMKEQGIERDLRDAVGSTLYSGTSEIQRNIIAKCLGL